MYAVLESMGTKRQTEVELAVSDTLSDDPDELMISNDILRSLNTTSHFQLRLRLHLSATPRKHLNAYEVVFARIKGFKYPEKDDEDAFFEEYFSKPRCVR